MTLSEPRFSDGAEQEANRTAHGIWLLARSNFEVHFEPEQRLSERIIFPATPSQRNGIEDARFVYFKNDDGTHSYYATFSAYDGRVVVPELMETTDFLRFRFITLNGPAAQNKGMALFPRKINGHYAMLSRQDNENIYLMFSDNVHFWNETQSASQASLSVGVHPAGELRLSHRDRGRMAGAQPRSRTDAKVLHRRFPARSRRSLESNWPRSANRYSRRIRMNEKAMFQMLSTRAELSFITAS